MARKKDNRSNRGAPFDEIEMREQVATERRFWLKVSRACNNRCIFCLDSSQQDGGFVAFDDLAAAIRAARAKGAERLILSGGEATIHPRFTDLVSEGARAGYDWVQVISNGRMFCYPDFARRAVQAGLREVTVSMHGPDAETHDRLTGIPGAFAQATAGIKNLVALGCLVTVDVVVNRLNHARLVEIVGTFHRLGVREFDILFITPFGRAWEGGRDLVYGGSACGSLPHEAAASIRAALREGERLGCTMWTNRVPPPILEGMESYIQDPHKILDEVRGRRALFDEVIAGKTMRCRDEARCTMCFVRDLCHALDRDVRAFRSGGPDAAVARAGSVDAAVVRALARARRETRRLVVEIPRAGDTKDAAAIVAAARPMEIEVLLDDRFGPWSDATVAGLARFGAAWYGSSDPRALKRLAAAGLRPRAVLTRATVAALRRDAKLRGVLKAARAGVLVPTFSTLTDELAHGPVAADATRVATDLDAVAAGLPYCFGGEPAGPDMPRLDVFRGAAKGPPTVDLDAFTADFLARRFVTKSFRCASCLEDARCRGVHITHARAWGYSILTPFQAALDSGETRRRVKRAGRRPRRRALLVSCDQKDLVYAHLLRENVVRAADEAGVPLDVVSIERPTVIAEELGVFSRRAPAGGERHVVDSFADAVRLIEDLFEARRWGRVVFDGWNEVFFGALKTCRDRRWRPSVTMYDAHVGAGEGAFRPFFATLRAALSAAIEARTRIVAPFTRGVIEEVYLPEGFPPAALHPVRQWIDTAFFSPPQGTGVPAGKFVLACGSTLRDWKTMFNAAPRLRLPLHVAAGGTIEGAPRGVTFHPRLTLRRYRDLIASAAAVVVPIGRENAGITSALIAMAVGRPVVVGRSRYLADYILEGKTCLSFDPGDAADLVAKVNALLDTPQMAAALGRSARRFAAKDLGPESLFRSLFLRR